MSISLHIFPLCVCRCSVTSCLRLLPLYCLCHNGLFFQTVSKSQPFLLNFLSVMYVPTVIRNKTNRAYSSCSKIASLEGRVKTVCKHLSCDNSDALYNKCRSYIGSTWCTPSNIPNLSLVLSHSFL